MELCVYFDRLTTNRQVTFERPTVSASASAVQSMAASERTIAWQNMACSQKVSVEVRPDSRFGLQAL